jgi:hypothetical protein
MLTELQVVNAQLATMGEAPLPSLDIPHPYVVAGIAKLAEQNKLIQARGWWFNTRKVTLTPDTVDPYAITDLPTGTLQVYALDGTPLSLDEDLALYDHKEEAVVTTAREVRVVREIAFASLPILANLYVAAAAVYHFQSDFDSDGEKRRTLGEQMTMRYAELHAEHIRVMKTNLLYGRDSTAYKLLSVRGNRPYISTSR